jgi:hypothetical protein
LSDNNDDDDDNETARLDSRNKSGTMAALTLYPAAFKYGSETRVDQGSKTLLSSGGLCSICEKGGEGDDENCDFSEEIIPV